MDDLALAQLVCVIKLSRITCGSKSGRIRKHKLANQMPRIFPVYTIAICLLHDAQEKHENNPLKSGIFEVLELGI